MWWPGEVVSLIRRHTASMNPATATRTTVLTATDVRNPTQRRRTVRRGVRFGMFVVTHCKPKDAFSDSA